MSDAVLATLDTKRTAVASQAPSDTAESIAACSRS